MVIVIRTCRAVDRSVPIVSPKAMRWRGEEKESQHETQWSVDLERVRPWASLPLTDAVTVTMLFPVTNVTLAEDMIDARWGRPRRRRHRRHPRLFVQNCDHLVLLQMLWAMHKAYLRPT